MVSASSSSVSLSSSYGIIFHSEATRIPDSANLSISRSPASHHLLSTLPAEIILLIAQHLQYPDLLALRHTHSRFLNTKLLSTSSHWSKAAWLVDRFDRGLEIPEHGQLRLDSDAVFCSQAEVRRIMRRRLRHGECSSGKAGCLLVEGAECGGPKDSGSGYGRPDRLNWRSGLKMMNSATFFQEGSWMLVFAMVIALVAVAVIGAQRYSAAT